MSTKNCDNCEHEDKREPFNYGDCEECKRFHIDADETFKDVWTQKVTNDYEKEFDEKFCPKGIGQCKVLNTEDPCDACKLVWNAACEMMSSKILELEQIIKSKEVFIKLLQGGEDL